MSGDARPDGDARDPSSDRARGDQRGGHLPHLLPDTDAIRRIDADELRATGEPHWLNVPNGITFLRALLVPVILVLLAQRDHASRWWAFGIFVFAAATDSIDGWVARRWHGVTRWGQLADPIADKLLIVGSLVALAMFGDLPWWAVVVIVLREVAVTVLRLVLVRRYDLVMPASWWGKSKTISQVWALALYLAPGVSPTLRGVVLYVAIALTLWSGIDYAFRAGKLARDAQDRI
jgi:CDP-diacylglycerol---glycerol-3-phosphate 3-phosphatidyltransferase